MQSFISLLYFIIVIIIMFGAYFTTRWLAANSNKYIQGKYIKQVDRIVFGKDKSILIVSIGEKYFLFSENINGLNLITDLNKEDLLELESTGKYKSFRGLLSEYLDTDKSSKNNDKLLDIKELKAKISDKFDKIKRNRRENGTYNDKEQE